MALDSRVSLQKLEVFCLVVRLGGVGKAAEELFVSQPVVSTHLRSLEERVGVTLFYRDGRKMRLTDAGVLIHEWAEDVLTRSRELDRDLARFSEGDLGTISFGASQTIGSYLLPDLLSRFAAEHPGVRLRLNNSDIDSEIDDIRRGVTDFSVIVTEPDAEWPGMLAEHIGNEEIVLVAAPVSALCGDLVSLVELASLPFIEGISSREFFEHQLRRVGVRERRIVLEVGHPEAMKRMLRSDLGVALMLRSAVSDELEHGTLRSIPIDGGPLTVPVKLVRRKNKTLSPVHSRLIAEIRSAFATTLGGQRSGHPETDR